MKLVFIRHGISEPKDPSHSDLDDFRRQLTEKGRTQAKKMRRQFSSLLDSLDVLYTSGLLRASETAEIMIGPHTAFELLPELDKLVPAEKLLSIIEALPEGTYGFTGHNPQLPEILSLLLSGDQKFELKKGGIAVLEGRAGDMKMTVLVPPWLVVE